MGRRIRWLGVIMVVCLGLVVAQLVNIQLVKAKQLQTSPHNPQVAAQKYVNPRGTIYAADGTVLANSIKTPPGTDTTDYPYQYVRQYPQGPLYAGITGYDSALYYGTAGIEQEYDSYLSPHQQPPQTLSQLIFRQQQPLTTDNVTLTVQPSLQNAAWQALTTLPPGANKDGAVVVLQPSTGNVLAMVSNPTFDPNTMASTSLQAELLAYYSYTQKDHEGFFPLRPIANRETFPPGSTMKVVTSTAAYNLKPSLAGFNFPVAAVRQVLGLQRPTVRPVRALRRDDDPDAPVLLRPRLCRARRAARRPHHDQAVRAVRVQLGPGHRPAGHVRIDLPAAGAELAGLPGAELHRSVQRADHRAPERHGGGGDRQQGPAHDAPPDVRHPHLPGLAGADLHARRRSPRWRPRRPRSR